MDEVIHSFKSSVLKVLVMKLYIVLKQFPNGCMKNTTNFYIVAEIRLMLHMIPILGILLLIYLGD